MKTLRKGNELSRRQFVSGTARALLGVGLLPISSNSSFAASFGEGCRSSKSVIYLHMAGGMSHLDTFDPKPDNLAVMGSTKAISTNANGIRIGHQLPHTSKVMDKVCVINSMQTMAYATHEQAVHLMRTSHELNEDISHPSLGAWVARGKKQSQTELPAFVALDNFADHVGSGFFSERYAPIFIRSFEEENMDLASLDYFERNVMMADLTNCQFHTRYQMPEARELYGETVKAMKSRDLVAFDLSQESEANHKLYGKGRFAQGCLLARRLVEHGTRFVEVALNGWDTHIDNFTGVAGRCHEFDQAYAALITDLEACGLLRDTLVVVATEFGRSPVIQAAHRNGREHHTEAFSCLLAGGGIKGGVKYGKTDETGSRVIENPVTFQDFNATIARTLGLPYHRSLIGPNKQVVKMASHGSPIQELIA
jgi:hypothetical protein